MNCERFEDRLTDYLEHQLSDVEQRAAESHLAGCAQCAALVGALHEALGVLPAADAEARTQAAPRELAGAILERTSGSGCERAVGLLPEFVDHALEPLLAELVQSHVEHCERCTALHGALVVLTLELPQMAALDPGAEFTRAVVEATSGARQTAEPGWRDTVETWWRRMVVRPRFAWEAAYVALLLIVALCGTSASPFRNVPARALALVQVDPRAAARDAGAQLRALHSGVGALGQRAWDETAGRVAGGGRDQASSFADHHPGMHEAYGSFQIHWGVLQQSLGDHNFAGTTLALHGIGSDVRALWSSWTGVETSNPAPPP